MSYFFIFVYYYCYYIFVLETSLKILCLLGSLSSQSALHIKKKYSYDQKRYKDNGVLPMVFWTNQNINHCFHNDKHLLLKKRYFILRCYCNNRRFPYSIYLKFLQCTSLHANVPLHTIRMINKAWSMNKSLDQHLIQVIKN